MDANDQIVSSVLIKNGRFAAVDHGRGNDDGDCARTINLRGRTAVPGIIDSHNHIILLGLRPGRDARLENANSIGEALATLAARAGETQPGEWVTSVGRVSRNQFFRAPQAVRFPTLAELTAAVPDTRCSSWKASAGREPPTRSAGRSSRATASRSEPMASSTAARSASPRPARRRFSFCARCDARLDAAGFARRDALRRGHRRHHASRPGRLPVQRPLVGDASDGAADFDRYRAHDSVRALYHQGELTNRIWINFLHVEKTFNTPETEGAAAQQLGRFRR